jgi:hypothetical protein
MIISHRRRFVVFLPWKTASQTLVARLKAFNESPYSLFFEFNPVLNRVVHQHMTCADFHLLPESRLGYFRASFVRNPYDRFYSGFRQLQKDIVVQPKAKFPSRQVRSLVMKQLGENQRQIDEAGGDFDRWVGLIDERQVLEQGRNSNFPLHPAHYWTHLGQEKVVDFIGRVERFESDMDALSAILKLGKLPAVDANVVELDARPSMGRPGYRYADRMSKSSISKINALFSRDFEIFDYERIDA